MTLAIKVENARRRYGAKAAVDGASLELNAGKITCLLGPSGCGKSTLLRLIAGLEPLDGGVVRTPGRLLSGDGVFVEPEHRDIGLVFQDYALFPHLTIEQNVAFGLSKVPSAKRKARALAELDRVRLADRATSYPQTLSGGEQQRVALARALARDPKAVLLDEPFSGLDGRLKAEVRDAALETLRDAGAAVLIVTHDAEEAMMMGDEVALMQSGRILQAGAPRDCYLRPRSLAAAKLLGEVDDHAAQVADRRAVTAFGAIPAPDRADGPATLLARPEAYVIGDEGVRATVVATRFRGAITELSLVVDGAHAHAHVSSTTMVRTGDHVRVTLDPVFCALV